MHRYERTAILLLDRNAEFQLTVTDKLDSSPADSHDRPRMALSGALSGAWAGASAEAPADFEGEPWSEDAAAAFSGGVRATAPSSLA